MKKVGRHGYMIKGERLFWQVKKGLKRVDRGSFGKAGVEIYNLAV